MPFVIDILCYNLYFELYLPYYNKNINYKDNKKNILSLYFIILLTSLV